MCGVSGGPGQTGQRSPCSPGQGPWSHPRLCCCPHMGPVQSHNGEDPRGSRYSIIAPMMGTQSLQPQTFRALRPCPVEPVVSSDSSSTPKAEAGVPSLCTGTWATVITQGQGQSWPWMPRDLPSLGCVLLPLAASSRFSLLDVSPSQRHTTVCQMWVVSREHGRGEGHISLWTWPPRHAE